MVRALNLGCGNDYRESTDEIEWVNLDNGNCRVDVKADIESPPWPYFFPIHESNFDRIDAIQVLEHISKENFPNVIREMYRISKPGAVWNIAVPHGFSDNFITDPTHKMPFSTRTFDYFIDDSPESRGLRENGIIYGWGDVCLTHIKPPFLDGNQSINFTLGVIKD